MGLQSMEARPFGAKGQSMSNIKAGDVVILKSGGPSMTVESVAGPAALCSWFNDKNQERKSFQLAALKLYEEPGPSSPR